MGNCMAKHDDLNNGSSSNNNNGLPFPANKKKPTNTTIPSSLSGIAATETMATDLTNNNINNHSTAALLKPILTKIVFPIVEYVASVNLVKEKMLLWDEEIMEEKDIQKSNLPLAPFDLALENVIVVDLETLYQDQMMMPEFAWPEKERIIANHNNKLKDDNDMLVLDILGLALRVNLKPGVEFTVPVDAPFGVTVDLEIGSGGQIKYGWIEFEIPKVRIWIINNKANKTQKVYVAIMARPSIVPNLHVNADRGKGDFFEMEFAGGGSFDDIIETILCSFGPSSITQPDDDDDDDEKKKKKKDDKKKKKDNNQTTNWVADALGRQISKQLSSSGLGGNKPLDIDLSEGIKDAIDDALGVPRPVEEVKAEMIALEEELKISEQYEKDQQKAKNREVAVPNVTKEEEKKEGDMVIVDVADDEIGTKGGGGPCAQLACCGFGST